MAFRINRGIFQSFDNAQGVYKNRFKLDADGTVKEVDDTGNVTAAYLKVGDKASDSNLLDGIDSSNFLRSNVDDTASGNITFSGTMYINSVADNNRLNKGNSFVNPRDPWNNFHIRDGHGQMYFDSGAYHFRTSTGSTEWGYWDADGLRLKSGWLRVDGSQGIYFQSYGGGWRMTDSTWIRAYNDKNIYTGGSIEVAGTIRADNGFQVDGSTIIDGGGTVVGDVNNTTTVADYFVQEAHGNPRNNLGSPTVTEMSLFNEQFNNKTAFYDPSKVTVWQQATDGAPWEDITSNYGDTTIRRFIAGYDTSGNVYIPNGVFKFRIEVSAVSYVFLNALYMYWSSDSHSTKVHVWKRRVSDSQWFQHTSSNTNVSSWPGHLYLPFSTIPFLAGPHTSTGHYDIVRFEFIPNWSGHATYGDRNINLNKMQIWGGYPAGTRFPYTINEYGDFTSRRDVYASKFIDKDNAGYYLDPVNTSNLLDVTARNITTSGTLSTQGQTYFSGQTSQLNVENIGSFARLAFNKLDFYDWQWGSMLTLENGNVSTNGTVIATNFADYNDTNYYVNPASDARLRHLYVGDVAGSNDGSWNARMKVIGSSHARLDVVSNSDGIVTTMFSHTGHGAGKVGTYSNHPLKFIINGVDKATLDSSGNLSINGSFSASGYNSTNWNTAYGWGNHASAGYLTSLPSHTHGWGEITGKPSTFTPSAHSHYYITNNYSAAESGSFHSWDAQESTPDKNPTTDWFTALRIGHGHPVNYYSNTLAIQMTGGDLGRIYTRTISNGNKQSWNKYWHGGDFSSTNISNWNTAYGWGNHASAGYLTGITSSQVTTALGYTPLSTTGKAADSNLFDGIDSVNFVYGNAKGTNDSVTTDADGIDKTGYYTSSAFTTRPSSVGNWMYIEHIKLYNNNTRYQKQIGYDTYDNRMWVRTKNDNSWLEWAQVWTSDVFANNSSNWDTAYSWGNHASAGYLTSVPSEYLTQTEGDARYASAGKTNTHTSFSDLNQNPSVLGWTYYTGTTNSPHDGSQGGYKLRVGLGSDYGTNTGSSGHYAMEMLMPRTSQAASGVGYLYMRQMEGGAWDSWSKIKAGYADTAGSANAVAWSNVSGKPSTFAPSSHNHDDRYYTETEVNNLLAGKLGSTAKAADSEGVDGVDSSRIVFGDGSRKSKSVSTMDNSTGNESGFFFYNNPTGNPFGDWTHWISCIGDSWTNNYGYQLAHAFHSDSFAVRRVTNGSYGGWRNIVTDANIGSMSVNYANTAGSANAVAWSNVSGKPSTFAPSSHTHTPSEVGLSNLSNNGNSLSGAFTATGDITAFSDIRVKENIQTIPNALESVCMMRGVTYNKIGSEKESVGVVAQEIKEVLPQVVHENEDGMLSVAYGNITGVLIEAIKEQQKQIEELKSIIDGLTK